MKHYLGSMCTLLLLAGAWPLAAQDPGVPKIAGSAEQAVAGDSRRRDNER
jgi:hypothetical protein